MKIREMESKLELELTTRGRLDTQIARSGFLYQMKCFFIFILFLRLKEMIEKLTREGEEARMREQSSQVGGIRSVNGWRHFSIMSVDENMGWNNFLCFRRHFSILIHHVCR